MKVKVLTKQVYNIYFLMLARLFLQQLHQLLSCAEISGKSMYILWDIID